MKRSFLNGLIEFLSPSRCQSCDAGITGKTYLCNGCRENLTYTDVNIVAEHYTECFAKLKYISSLHALFIFEKDKPIQNLLHKIKYGNRFKLAFILGSEFAEHFQDDFKALSIDSIIPIPLYHSKKAERGYNQSFYFAKGIHKVTGIKITNRLLKRIRFTDTQTALNRSERIKNVDGAFNAANKNLIRSRSFLLVDDVLTTGSTINECAKVLLENGAKQVHAGTIAIA